MTKSVLLATCAALPDGEPGGALLTTALAARGIDSRWVAWDDRAADWPGADLVAARSTWDYEGRREEFLAWAAALGPRLLNGAETFAWNVDKGYLLELAATGVPVVPTVLADDEQDLPAAIAEVSPGDTPHAVVKPRVGAGGRGVVVFDGVAGGVAELDETALRPGPWVVQPLVDAVRTEGEHSIHVLAGEVLPGVVKRPTGDEVRVHERYGGSTVPEPLTEEASELARRAVAAAEQVLGRPLDYARVDALRLDDGTLAVSELELTEPGLYLDVLPDNAAAFADLVVRRLAREGR